jgi:hypothetical protein
VPGQLGQRAAVALERRTEKEFAVIIAGDVAKDSRETLGGMSHGCTENRQFVSRMINHLAASIDSGEKRLHIASAKFSTLERELGDLIENVLTKNLSGTAIYSAFPARVLENISRDGPADYAMANYSDLIDIILHNWNNFTPFFGQSKTQFKNVLASLNFGVRRFIAHPHKAKQMGYDFPRKDIDAIEAALGLVQSAQQKYRTV